MAVTARRARHLAVVATALLAAAWLLSGCGSDDDAPGPLGSTRAPCVVSDAEGELIVHPGSLTADGPVVLGEAVPVDAVNLVVVEQDVVAFSGRATIQGVITDYPPLPKAGLADSLARWQGRRPLEGTALGPQDGQQAVLVSLRLVDPDRSGHLDGVTLSLTEDGAPSRRDFAQPLLVEPPGRLCTVDEVDATRSWVDQAARESAQDSLLR